MNLNFIKNLFYNRMIEKTYHFTNFCNGKANYKGYIYKTVNQNIYTDFIKHLYNTTQVKKGEISMNQRLDIINSRFVKAWSKEYFIFTFRNIKNADIFNKKNIIKKAEGPAPTKKESVIERLREHFEDVDIKNILNRQISN